MRMIGTARLQSREPFLPRSTLCRFSLRFHYPEEAILSSNKLLTSDFHQLVILIICRAIELGRHGFFLDTLP